MNISGMIMLVMGMFFDCSQLKIIAGNQVCESDAYARAVLKNNPGVLGQLILCAGRTCSVLGHSEAREYGNDQSIQFPSIEADDYLKIWTYMQQKNREPVIVHIHDTGKAKKFFLNLNRRL